MFRSFWLAAGNTETVKRMALTQAQLSSVKIIQGNALTVYSHLINRF